MYVLTVNSTAPVFSSRLNVCLSRRTIKSLGVTVALGVASGASMNKSGVVWIKRLVLSIGVLDERWSKYLLLISLALALVVCNAYLFT